MPGFQGHGGIQCMMKKCFLLPPHHLGEKAKIRQTDNPTDNITILITLVILLSETQLYITIWKRVHTSSSRTYGFSKNDKCLRYTVYNNMQYIYIYVCVCVCVCLFVCLFLIICTSAITLGYLLYSQWLATRHCPKPNKSTSQPYDLLLYDLL